jgi:multiple sugar transport system permease protein
VQRGQALKVGLVLASPIVVYFAAFFVYPLFNLLQNAFTSDSGAFTLANFQSMLSDPILSVSLSNTAYYFVGSVGLEYSVGFVVAILLYAYTGRLKTLFRTIIFLPLMVSPVVIGLMWLLILNTNYGPLDYILSPLGLGSINWIGSQSLAMPSLILANTWEYSPFVFLIIYAGLQTVSPQLYEAASVDGLSRFQTFRFITLPAIRPSIVVAFLLNSIGVLKGFDLIYVLTNGGPGFATYILSFYTYVVGFSFFETHYAAAISLLFLAIIGTFVFAMLRFTSVEEYLGLRRGKGE